jgi:hypothetical protein
MTSVKIECIALGSGMQNLPTGRSKAPPAAVRLTASDRIIMLCV